MSVADLRGFTKGLRRPAIEKVLGRLLRFAIRNSTVRVFVGGASLADASTPDDLSSAYVANVVDFLGKARARGVQVIVVAEGVPPGTSYADQVAGGSTADFAGENVHYLTAASVSGRRPSAQTRRRSRSPPGR